MQEQFEYQIKEWSDEVDRLTGQRQKLAAALSDLDASIQRHLGAIEGARQLLMMLLSAPDEPAQGGPVQEEPHVAP